ncbi:unnamed protein product [Ilex paraguariensis]|uniref:serine C-palmitoyltransferase n=1 Tax=Ilex paraguariensis TaxID=185542 RepID=A0ABC8QLG8_9AQUA
MDEMTLDVINLMKTASNWVTIAFEAPFAQAVVFGVHIGVIVINGKEVLNFASANYLGLVGLEKLLKSCTSALEKYSIGSCGPRGFYGTIGQNSEVFGNSRFHTLLTLHYVQCNSGFLQEMRYYCCANCSPLDDIIKLKEKHCFRVLLDENNSFGVLGNSERGLTEYHGVLIEKIDIVTVAMGHALATEGGFCSGSVIIDFNASTFLIACVLIIHDVQRLSNFGYLFSASLPPYLVNAVVIAIDVLEQNPYLITKLRKNITILCRGVYFYHCLEIVSDQQSPIVFLRLKKSTGSLKNDLSLLEDIAHHVLKEDSIFVETSNRSMLNKWSLPVGIRLFVSATHTESDLTKACESLKRVASLVLTAHV